MISADAEFDLSEVLLCSLWAMTEDYIYSSMPRHGQGEVDQVVLLNTAEGRALVWVYCGCLVRGIGDVIWRMPVW